MADKTYAGKTNGLFVSPNSNGNFTFRTFPGGGTTGGVITTLRPDALRDLRYQINEHLGEDGGTRDQCEPQASYLDHAAIRGSFMDLANAAGALADLFEI